MSVQRWTDDPVFDAEVASIDTRKKIGICEECGHEVYAKDDCFFEDDTPYLIERSYFHEGCIMDYAKKNWKLH